MKKHLIFSKESLDKKAQAAVENPTIVTQVLATSNFDQFNAEWFSVLEEPISHFCAANIALEDIVKQQMKDIKITILFYFVFVFIGFFFTNQDMTFREIFIDVLKFITPCFFFAQFLDYKLVQVKTINAASILLKEVSLNAAVRFDYFFNHDKIKEQYIHLTKTNKMEEFGNHRLYLSFVFEELAYTFIKKAAFNSRVQLQCIENVAVFHKKLLTQFDSRVFLHENYRLVFKHAQSKFI